MSKTSKTHKPKNHRKSVILFAALALLLVPPTILLTRASKNAGNQAMGWFFSGEDARKVADGFQRERQYLYVALGFGSVSFAALCAAILFEAKHIKQTRAALQTLESSSDDATSSLASNS